MREWRFGENPEDGEAWLKRPDVFHVYVDYLVLEALNKPRWRRVMIATRSWLSAQIGSLEVDAAGPSWVGLPAMLIVPDAVGESLRDIVASVVQQGGFDHYSTPLGETQPSQT
jgi:hypothetical protein